MKKVFLFTLLLITYSSCDIQAHPKNDHRREIREILAHYFQATIDKNYEKMLEMIYPRLFDIVTKEEMLTLFRQIEAEGITYFINGAETTSISDRILHNGEQFVLIKYNLDIGIRFTGEQYTSPEALNRMFDTFKTQYGSDRVNLDIPTHTFWIKADNVMYAIASEGSKEWKFMEVKPGMEAFKGDFIPKEVSDKLE